MPLTGLKEYAKVEILGELCFLRPSYPGKRKIQKELGLDDPQYGYMFGIVGGAAGGAIGGAISGSQMAVKRVPIIYRMSDGRIGLLTKNSILKLLDGSNELKERFLSEKKQDDEETLLKYLKLMNEM